jgi:potassium efflux system protein
MFLCPNATAQDADAEVLPTRLVTPEIIEAKIQEVEAATGLGEESKNKLIELYRKALSNLQSAASNAEAAETYQRATETAAIEVQAIREALDESNVAAPEAMLDADMSTPLHQLESLLQKEKASLGAVEVRRAEFSKRLMEESGRPGLIRQRLAEATEQQDEIAAQLQLPVGSNGSSAKAEALRWELETSAEALSAEIKMLDQELLSQPVRVDLLKAKQDKAAARVVWIGKRVKILEDLGTRQRQADADEAKRTAEATRLQAEGRHPLVVDLAEQNAALTQEIASTASELDELAEHTEKIVKLAQRLEEDYAAAEETVSIGVYGLSEELGYLLLQQRQSLPDLRSFRHKSKELDRKSGKIGARRLIHRREQKRLSDPVVWAGIVADAATEETPLMRKRLIHLAAEREELLDKAVETEDVYLRRLGELESAQQRLLAMIERLDDFLNVHLLWVRSASPAELRELGALPEQVWRILSPVGWLGAAGVLLHRATHSPVFVLLGLALGALLWSRKRLIGSLVAIEGKLGKPTTDRFVYSLQTLGVTLIVAAAWPLVAAVAGWQLKVSGEATDFSIALGGAFLDLAVQFYLLRAFRLICAPRGLAAGHFRWPESSLRLLRRELDRLSWIYLPAVAVTLVSYHLDPLNLGWALGRTAFVVVTASLAFAFYSLLHPASGVLATYARGSGHRTFRRLQRFWYPLLVIAPLALGLLSVLGYIYTAGTLMELLVDSTWMIVGLVLISSFAQRWLRMTRRRLAYEAAIERRQALLESKQQEGPGPEETGAVDLEEEEVDLADLTDTTRELINTAVVALGLIGLWMIWSEALPALRIFDDITLWHQTVTVDGEEQVDPITLADLGLALVYGIVTVLLAKKLPAVLEIFMLDHTEMSAGNRYTVTTLTTYTLITIGLVLVFRNIGADWSKLQWLIAALGVGIGFGLQEIVANFISGIILLFERPIRIGDVVTVGGTDGVVTRIRIRATTIRNWDGKELLVPNKAFITGNLLNWSLSDPTTRILISVGIAYGSDVRTAASLLEEAARENEVVLDDPPPSVIFEAFADSSLTLLLRCFVDSVESRFPTINALNHAINDKFNAAGIVIAFPQRDLHLEAARPLQVELRRTKKARDDEQRSDLNTIVGE